MKDNLKSRMYVRYTIVNRLTNVFKTYYVEFVSIHTVSRQKWKDLIDFIYEKHNPGNWDVDSIALLKERWLGD